MMTGSRHIITNLDSVSAFAVGHQEWNSTDVPYELDNGIDEIIEGQARRTPDALAVRARDGNLTYGELFASYTRLAKHLRHMGADEDTVIGLHCHRTKNLLIAMLAILKSGAALLPLDPALPSERIAYMLEQTDAGLFSAMMPNLGLRCNSALPSTWSSWTTSPLGLLRRVLGWTHSCRPEARPSGLPT